MGFIRRIGRTFRRIGGGLLKKAAGFLKKPMGLISKLTKPLMGIADKLLDKMPFGNLIKPFVQKFLSNPMALLGGAGLGMFAGLAGSAAKSGGGQLGNMVQEMDKAQGGMKHNCCPQALNNTANITAYSQAQVFISSGYC